MGLEDAVAREGVTGWLADPMGGCAAVGVGRTRHRCVVDGEQHLLVRRLAIGYPTPARQAGRRHDAIRHDEETREAGPAPGKGAEGRHDPEHEHAGRDQAQQ